MKNILIIKAHPSTQGKTHRIADAYRQASEKLGHTVTVMDLYAPENTLPFLSFEEVKEWPQSDTQARMQQSIAQADELVFVHPIWWGTVPAIMKNWIDIIFSTGFAYQYKTAGGWDKLLTGKTAKIFATSGAPAFVFRLPLFPFRSFWKTSTLGFCGVKVTDIAILGDTQKGSPEEREARTKKFLEQVHEMAKR